MNNFCKTKHLLVNFFINKEKYSIYSGTFCSKDNFYLYRIENKQFQIIKIIDNNNNDYVNYDSFDDNIIISLKKFLLKEFKFFEPKIFSIILKKDDNFQIFKNQNGNISLFVNNVDNNDLIDKIGYFYPNLFLFFDENNINNGISRWWLFSRYRKNISFFSSDENSNFYKWKNSLNNFPEMINPSNLVVTWILIILLSAFTIIRWYFFRNFSTVNLNSNSVVLICGGITRDLLIWSNQWWRLWTWPLFDENSNTNIFLFIVNFFLVFNISRYTEARIGRWKLLLLLIVGIPLSGLIISAIFPNNVFGGFTVILSILWGALFSYNFGKDDLFTLFLNQKTAVIPIWLFSTLLFSFDFLYFVVVLIFLFVGSSLGYLFDYNFKKINVGIFYPLFVLTTFIILPIILLNKYVYEPPINSDVINTLSVYERLGFLSREVIENMLNNYYHCY